MKQVRISEGEWLLEMAWVVSRRGSCSRLQVGAIICQKGRTVSSGYNGSPSRLPHCDHSDGLDQSCSAVVHAEANAIAFAARHGTAVDGGLLVCTHSPCLGCANLIINAGVRAVMFASVYKSLDGVDRLRAAGLQVWEGAKGLRF